MPERNSRMAIASVNPATGEVLKTFEPLTDMELAIKLDLAAAAFAAHRNTSFTHRAERMLKAAKALRIPVSRISKSPNCASRITAPNFL